MPLPATVVMIPSGETLRMRLLLVSAMNRLPALSAATDDGYAKLRAGGRSAIAGALLEDPAAPLPATVVMIPLGRPWRMR